MNINSAYKAFRAPKADGSRCFFHLTDAENWDFYNYFTSTHNNVNKFKKYKTIREHYMNDINWINHLNVPGEIKHHVLNLKKAIPSKACIKAREDQRISQSQDNNRGIIIYAPNSTIGDVYLRRDNMDEDDSSSSAVKKMTRSGNDTIRIFLGENNGTNSTTTAADTVSPNATVYYSLDGENGSRIVKKRQSRQDDEHQDNTLKRKQSRIDEAKRSSDVGSLGTPLKDASLVATAPPPDANFTLEEPDWNSHPTCFAFLQALNDKYENKYLMKVKTGVHDKRAGYIFGRSEDADIIVKHANISRQHFLIYMETGTNGVAKRIRIYLEDKSLLGTLVNDKEVGRNKRILLRNGDTISFLHRFNGVEGNIYDKAYRVCFPTAFEAQACEQKFELTRELGKGSFATVYLANRRETGEKVAIKVILKNRFAQKPKLYQSFITEMSVMMALPRHPLLVKIHEIFHEQFKMYYVLEYVRDGELFNYIHDNQKLSEDETRFIFWQLFTAVKFLHSQEIAHRDLKPENVLVADKKNLFVKISDFGLAKYQERNSAFDSQCGTPSYVAPEILDRSEVRGYTKKCDIWSLGVMLYICLCGYPPFSDENGPPSMNSQIMMGKYSFQSPFWDDVSTDAKKFIDELLTVDPEGRITATEALNHPWMQINPVDLEGRKNNFSPETIQAIAKSSSFTPLHATQSVLSFQ